MYAVIETGGKQYKVEKDLVIKVEKLEAEVGSKIDLSVLMVADGEKVITETAKWAVKAEVIAHDKARKVNIFKYKAKKNVRKRQGHRQSYTALKILEIKA